MGLLDGLAGQVLGSVLGGNEQGTQLGAGNMLQEILQMLQGQQGGLGGLVAQFQQAGLGDQVKSWISTGSNLPINADQLKAALGDETIANIASKLGMSQGDAAGGLADLLPQIVDKLTPNGQVSEGHDLSGMLGGLAGMFGR